LCFQLFLDEKLPPEIANMHRSSTRFIELTDKCFNGTFSVNSQYLRGSEDSKCRYHFYGTSAQGLLTGQLLLASKSTSCIGSSEAMES